jgi:hypothetical protein
LGQKQKNTNPCILANIGTLIISLTFFIEPDKLFVMKGSTLFFLESCIQSEQKCKSGLGIFFWDVELRTRIECVAKDLTV